MSHDSSVVYLVTVTVGLLLAAIVVLALSRRAKLPFTVALVLTGIGLGQAAQHGPAFLQPLTGISISPELVLFVFLPTLIFESAFNLDARQLRHNLLPVLTLAIPGLVLSTAVIGLIVHTVTGIDLPSALLLGAILSATDPVAVIALFKQLGTPKRLAILVEGESLFNDATALVLAKILLGVVAVGYVTWDTAANGLAEFLRVFLGGVLVGWLAAVLTGWLIARVEADRFIEISLTTILAYLSFLIAESALHVSGVMAVVAAGVTMGGWGRAKISPSVAGYLDHFWAFMAEVSNALIFLLVGLTVDLDALLDSLHILPWVILAMLVSRALVVFGLVPLVGFLSSPVSRAYQAVMYWGGLRGAIALAIVLSLEQLPLAELFVALVMGSVLFTLLAQGLSMRWLVHRLGLDRPPLAERLARTEGLLAAKQRALAGIPELQAGGLFSQRIAHRLGNRCRSEAESLRDDLNQLRSRELGERQERRLLYLRSLAAEKSLYYDLYSKGHLPESAYRDLDHSLDQQLDAVRQDRTLPLFTLHPQRGDPMRRLVLPLLNRLPWLHRVTDRLRAAYIARDYEEAWGRFQGSSHILAELAPSARELGIAATVVDDVRRHYQGWNDHARARLDQTAAQFPEFVNAMQERLAGRLVVHAQTRVIDAEARAGTLPSGLADSMVGELTRQVRHLRGRDLATLEIGPEELLRKVPFFRDIPPDEFGRVTSGLHRRMIPDGETIIHQGRQGDSLFLIARGVIRVFQTSGGTTSDLATLIAGDFFGEKALLHGELRTASCRAVTPSALYELKRADFDRVCRVCPAMQSALEQADRERPD